MKEHCVFNIIEKKPKTAVYSVNSKSYGTRLGKIYWYGSWRQYIFEPDNATIWSRECLKQVIDFIQKLMEERTRGNHE